MKKVMFGGFCLLTGSLIFLLMEGMDISLLYGTNIPDVLIQAGGIALAGYGFILGLRGMRED